LPIARLAGHRFTGRKHHLLSARRVGDTVSTFTSIFGPSSPRKKRVRFEDIPRFFSRAKIILVEIASTIGLLILLFEGIKHELKW
jgi:hypothetical protein